jgi:pilus assembly protein CpaB
MMILSSVTQKLKSPFALLLLAAVLAAGASWVAYAYLQQRETAIKAELAARGRTRTAPKVEVAVPKVNAAAGTVVNGATFVLREVEADLVYPDSVLAADVASVEGQKLARPVLRGRPLRLSDLVAPEIRDVSSILPSGQRALTIDIDNVNSIAQSLRPNNRVDIFLLNKGVARAGVAEEGGEHALEQATLYMQDVVVLATGSDFHDVSKADAGGTSKMVSPGEAQGREPSFDSVTLLVSPAQAARLMLGQKLGSFRLALRGSMDHAPIAMTPLRGSDVLPATGARRGNGIELIAGGRGEKLVSQLAVSPLQQMMSNAVLLQQRAAAGLPARDANGNDLAASLSTTPTPRSMPK